jgi:ABC-type nitrate/sulfonate/bicarbonate transport system ATPase subunit
MPGVASVLEVRIRGKEFVSPNQSVRQILGDVAFRAAGGEVLVLLGPSGVGKSTVLRIVVGLDRDFAGSVRLSPGRLGVMFQEPRLPPWLTVEQTLRLVQPAADVAGLLRDVMLPDAQRLLPSALSLGMAQRVALARALAVDPQVLVLDEPFASLDRSLAAALGKRLVDRVVRHDTLVLLSTHDVDQALTMATRILVLSGEPAGLAADIAVPARSDVDAMHRFRKDLLARFTFLNNQEAASQ